MKQRPFPHRRLCCPRGSIGTTAASDALPARRPFPGLRLSDDAAPARTAAAGPGRASPVPAATFRTFRALYAGEFLGAAIQVLRSFRGLRRERLGSALPSSHLAVGTLTARQASLDAADRSVAPPEGLLTLGFDPARFQAEPPACYRASWQLPGPDSHRQATASLCWISYSISTSNSGRTSDLWCNARTVVGTLAALRGGEGRDLLPFLFSALVRSRTQHCAERLLGQVAP